MNVMIMLTADALILKDNMSIQEAAQFYMDTNYRPLPIFGIHEKCKHRPVKPELDCKGQCLGKVPKIEHWPDKQISITDFDTRDNIALIMGKQKDGRWLVGFDIDGELDLSKWFDLPETLECSTNRGRHLIFEVPADTPLGNWNDILNTRSDVGYRSGYKGALDIKYCRGAMVSPPSTTKTQTILEWKEWRNPAKLPISVINNVINRRKNMFPNVERYRKWSDDPLHNGKNP